tara:strand:- start:41 stop:262 length:222 start_codon:yes stop_codon:yes gene_type:complete
MTEEHDETADIVADAVAQERAAVVAWLYRQHYDDTAERIERGEHRREEGAVDPNARENTKHYRRGETVYWEKS